MAGGNLGQKGTELKQQYVKSLPGRRDELRSSWNRLQYVGWDAKALAFMAQCAHKLVGSGGTFQFPEISDNARLLEEHLQPLLSKSDASVSERQQVDYALKMLESVIDKAINTVTSPATPDLTPAPIKNRRRIAVIEDDLSQAAYLANWLEQCGYHVETFDNPEAYNQRGGDESHDAILLDISFPQGALEGIAWLERLKCQVGIKIPVIMMSARSDMVARLRALRAGADTYLTKPLDLDVLEKRLHQLLEDTATSKPRVLWVDDDTHLLAYYKNMLMDEGYEVDCLSQAVRILERIEQFQPDVIVLDHEMPGCQGGELAKVLRQDARYLTIPILFVSGSQYMAEHLEQHSMSGNEVFRKPLDNQKFLIALREHLLQAQLINARINLVSQRRESRGLQNHDYFLTQLATFLAYVEAAPAQQSLHLVQVGIDREAYLRAQHGARAMATLIAHMESYFANQLEESDSGCALGGGCFLFQVSAPSSSDAHAFLDDFHSRLSSVNSNIGDFVTSVTLSMGVLPLDRAMSEDKALLEVESAYREAVEAGGNRTVWYQVPERSGHSRLDDRIRELLDARAFRLHYQPIVDMNSGDTLFEALVRLVDEDGVVYLPGQFLPLLRERDNGVFYDLDRWVIEHAIEELSNLAGKAAASHTVVIKISSPMADVAKMMSFISSGMRNARIKGKRRIFLALSSPTVLNDVPKAKQVLKVLQDMDCGLIIEHINAGSETVDLLKELGSVDFVKLAPKYGGSTEQTPELETLLNELTATFGARLPIVATRVEDAKALGWFWERGVRYFQGYFIQAPETAMDFEL